MASHLSTSTTFTTASGAKTTTLGALAAGEMVFVIVANTGNAALPTVTDNNPDGLGAYTAIAGPILKAASVDRMYIFARNALVGSTLSTIITMTPSGATTGGGLSASRWSGFTQVGSAAIVSGQIGKQDNQAAATPAPALPSAATTTNPTLGAVFNATNPATMTPTVNWTERTDVGYNTPTSGLEAMSRDSGFTGTTVTWGSASGSAFCSVIIELDASAGAATLVIQDATHSHAADNVVLTQVHNLTVADALHAHTADNVALIINLAIQDALHGHTADNVVLTQVHILAIADALHAHFGDNLVLTQVHNLAIQEALHAHAGDNLALTQVHVLAIQEALHAHVADNVVLAAGGSTDLVIQDAAHGHTADSLTLTQAHQLTITDAIHAQTADNLILTQVHNLVIQDALHAHLGDNVALSVPAAPGGADDDVVRMRRFHRLWTGS
jgi:hypothetical protein